MFQVVWPKVVAAYNELFEDSFEEDSKAFNESLKKKFHFDEGFHRIASLGFLHHQNN